MTFLLPSAAGTDRPEPVLDAAKIAAAVSGTVLAIGTAFVLVGWATADQVQNWAIIAGGIVTAVGALIAVVLPVITAYGARAQVTPLAAPVSVEGVPLITSAAPPMSVPAPREMVDDLRDLERADDDTQPAPAWPSTDAIPAAARWWTPPTPAAVAAEPTTIGAEAEAATTGRIPRASTPTA